MKKEALILLAGAIAAPLFSSPLHAAPEAAREARSEKAPASPVPPAAAAPTCPRADAPGAGVDAAALEEAKPWIRRAADQGSAEAQFMLGILSLQEADEECARRMLQACQYLDGYFAQRGDEEARQALQVISVTYEEKHRLTAELDRAAVLFRQAAEKGGAAYLLGCLFRDGRGVLPSRVEAARWFRKAAEQGDERAQSALARLAAEGEVRDEPIRLPEGEEDPVELGDLDDPVGSFWATSAELEEARQWVHRAADQGMEEAQVLLGIIRSRQWEMEAVSQYHGAVYGAHRVLSQRCDAVEKDSSDGRPADEKALAALRVIREQSAAMAERGADVGVLCLPILFRRYVEQGGAARAPYFIGRLLGDGTLVLPSPAEAARWIRKSAEGGCVEAQCKLGLLYHEGLGVEKSAAEAVKWFRRAAEQGYGVAQLYLGVIYYNGLGVEKSAEKAVKWFRLATEQGSPAARYNLGLCYRDGFGVEKSAAEAVKCFRRAAEQDCAEAQCNLGLCYQQGFGVEKSLEEAVKWYERSASRGCVEAQCNLGLCYLQGLGVEKSLRTAEQWLRLAADRGCEPAREYLRELEADLKTEPAPEAEAKP